MVCIAAFIILALIGLFVGIVSIFKPKVGKSYLKMFKKAWGCLWKKVRLQKCETGFKEDVKNTLLSRVIIKHPKWTKPLSILIEVLSVIIVIVAVWALLTAIKSLLALWALDSCNVTTPSACSLGSEVCSIDESEPKTPIEAFGRWFTEWGEIFEAIPEKFKTYNAADYGFNYINANPGIGADKPAAVDILDPGCSVCMISYREQKESGFFDNYDVHIVPYAIPNADGGFKFKNSEIVVKYMFAAEQIRSGLAVSILDHIFTKKSEDGRYYQDLFNDDYSKEDAIKQIEKCLSEENINESGISEIRKIVDYPETTKKIAENQEIVENQLKVKGIPTMIYDGKKHTGLYKK
ncbi:hypothetical protein IJG92_01850 [Candidatus Saccharibacteria bacterium]|nr:hypothetical protein [Candidatus Saccharibacteria bacterium]MBQ6149486.1 hypothetical protein [Candidatus Saccharibacteria bacterium]